MNDNNEYIEPEWVKQVRERNKKQRRECIFDLCLAIFSTLFSLASVIVLVVLALLN